MSRSDQDIAGYIGEAVMSGIESTDHIFRSQIPIDSLQGLDEEQQPRADLPEPDAEEGQQPRAVPPFPEGVKQKRIRSRYMEECRELPLFCMGDGIQYSECPGDVIALSRPQRHGVDVALFGRDGTLLRQIRLPEPARYAAVRGGRIYGFCKGSDCMLKDLKGNPLPIPWEDWPQEETYYDMSADGNLLLYLEERWSDHYNHTFEFRLKNLYTGMETEFFRAGNHSRNGDHGILNDRKVVFHSKAAKKINFYEALTGKETEPFFQNSCPCYAMDQEREIVIAAAMEYGLEPEGCWNVIDAEGTLLREWKENCVDIVSMVMIPHSDLIVYVAETHKEWPEKYALRIRDFLTGQILFDEALRDKAKPLARPDGREIYASYTDSGIDAWALEYNYEE